MNWNPSDIIPGHLLTVIILAGVGGALLITLIIIIIIKAMRKRAKKMATFTNYSIIQLVLFKTKFTYSINEKESDKYHYFVKVNYCLFDHYFTYHIYVSRCKEYLELAKKEIHNSIVNEKLCKHTLKIIPYKEFKKYAAC